jgi:hypothetical protein
MLPAGQHWPPKGSLVTSCTPPPRGTSTKARPPRRAFIVSGRLFTGARPEPSGGCAPVLARAFFIFCDSANDASASRSRLSLSS